MHFFIVIFKMGVILLSIKLVYAKSVDTIGWLLAVLPFAQLTTPFLPAVSAFLMVSSYSLM